MAEIQTNSVAWEMLLDLGATPGPKHLRLEHAIRDAVATGRVPSGAALPPSRLLAASLGVSRWVVTEVYGRLAAEGILEARTGSATRVAASVAVAIPRPAPEPPAALKRPRFDLAPGVPDLRHAPRARWLRAMSAALTESPDAELFRLDADVPAARAAVASYLSRSRFARAEADAVVVTHGAADGMRRLARALRALGHRSLLVEDPSWPRMREVAAAEGLASVPVAVDEEGIDVDALVEATARTGARAVLSTPAHQFPLGAALSASRRERLVEWAREHEGVVIEDDYDAEFRYDRRPVGALQAMAPDRVALVGSLSKSATPALGLGWMVLPPWLHAPVTVDGAASPSTLDQLALARFVAAGDLDRHLRAARTRYRRRRETVLDALSRRLPECRVSGIAAGLHVVLELQPDVSAARVVGAAAERDVAITDLRRYRVSPASRAQERLVLGYGNLADPLVDEAVARLADAVREVAGPR